METMLVNVVRVKIWKRIRSGNHTKRTRQRLMNEMSVFLAFMLNSNGGGEKRLYLSFVDLVIRRPEVRLIHFVLKLVQTGINVCNLLLMNITVSYKH